MSRASAAGVTWTSRTLKAEWAGRYGHTTVIDANSGAIYVIGGRDFDTYYSDVWVSPDRGARAGLGPGGWSAGRPGGHYKGTTWGTTRV